MKAKQELPILVVDLGFSAAKYKFGKKLGRTTSAFRPHGTSFIVGDKAMVTSSYSHLRTPDELLKFYPFFVRQILSDLGVATPVSLAVGLPYKFWKDAQDKERPEWGAVDHLKKRLRGEDEAGKMAEVQVLPQGLGGIVCHLSTRTDAPTGNILGVDFGFNTIIVTLYSATAKKIIWDQTYYLKGVHQMVMDYLCPTIEHLLPAGRPTNPLEYMQYLEMGFIQHANVKHSITSEIAIAAHNYIQQTLSEIMNELRIHGGVRSTFDEVLFFGGGARFLPKMEEGKIKMHVLPEPEFANAKGFEILAKKEG